ncbi:Fatty acyl-CoA synthetase and RNA processing-associated kinase 1 [Hypsizygus marmoreus]|uniref:non-specific serine/threonine protein kinase n=1 Tax=Hypsizygus marmoreus TaxID=39966 RepID=A0A369J929_HYPMA|nr:Fatty acyl-CoA synthetase and RNA processing-associated kinase 1 [Hypsizygus marmoreus]
MNPSTSLQIPSQDSPLGPRPVSVSVNPAPPPPSSSRRQQRASHTVVSGQQSHAASSSNNDTPPYTDVYSHPAAMAYAAAHPRRTIPKFGPYLLLQTLGEGEFGKVKLGLHSQWGEEVAVKLIRRGNVDNTIRMSKVEREIEVLRTLKHPNIVRLYDVIETDKYIGIILEYASGGELFDHILAHRYLRERDAAKLFSQLISGVWYIHQKKIVHRDLKLENLLLDRHRNVIITDFGFANRFEHRSDDLMQTSCGSPCYAAPELVISEGLYVGSAVDIWSCGVILYAMLAGYLPFDDDPANPDGDNINLLYKYIVNTPLSFPEYISAEARDLLSVMLVPDPKQRSSLDGVMRHPWLSAYALPPAVSGTPNAFGKTVEQLERAAMEQHQQKRLAYQKQMKAAAMAAAHPHLVSSPVGRAHSHHIGPGGSGSGHRTTAPDGSGGGRSHSAQPEYLYDSSADLSMSTPAPSPGQVPAATTKQTHVSPAPGGDDDPFGPSPGAAGKSQPQPLAAETTSPAKSNKANGSAGASGGFRHTIQVEYDEPRTQARKSEDKEERARGRSGSHGQGQNGGAVTSPPPPPKERRPSQGSISVAASKPLPASPVPTSTPSSFRGLPAPPASAPAVSTSPSQRPSTFTTPLPATASPNSTPTKNRVRSASQSRTAPSTPVQQHQLPNISVDAASPPGTPIAFASGRAGDESEKEERREKGRTSVDKLGLGLGKMFSSSGHGGAGENGSSRVPSDASTSGRSGRSASSLLNGSGSGESGGRKEKAKAEKEKEGKKSRRNTLTVMVEPFSRTIRNRTGGSKSSRMATTPIPTASLEPSSAVNTNASVGKPKQPHSAHPGSGGDKSGAAGPVPSFAGATGEMAAEGPGMHASTSKARKVMQWFRSKSKVTDVGVDEDEERDGGERDRQGTPTQAEYNRSNATLPVATSAATPERRNQPQLVVTTPTASKTPSVHNHPSTSHAPTHPHRTPSNATADSSFASFTTPSLVTRFRNSVTIGGVGSHPPSSSSKAAAVAAAAHPWGALRTHHGAVDQSTITTKAPPEVMRLMREVLESMGVEIQIESEYKFRCIRAKRRKGSLALGAAMTGGLGSVGPAVTGTTAPGLAAVTMVGSAASNGVDKRGLPLPSPSSFTAPGGMLRGLLMRRQSSQVSQTNGALGSPLTPTPFDEDPPIVIEPTTIQETAYGDPAQDAGDEVRFSVELTRIDRLSDTFSLDVRRLKGNLRSYKFLYDTIRQRADLQR